MKRKLQLKTLPPEILDLIASYLALIHLPSVLKLAWLSKSLYASCVPAAKPFFFSTITLTLDGHKSIKHDVAKIIEKLEHAKATPYVRRFAITGGSLDEEPGFRDRHWVWRPPRLHELRFDDPEKVHDSFYPYRHLTTETAYGRIRVPDIDEPHKRNKHWKPVAELIRRLPALRDLHFSCYVQFPSQLLDALHKYRPECRLHLQSFWLRSAMISVPDEYELRLISSPSLHTIMIRYDVSKNRSYYQDLYSGPNYQKFALQRILRLAPNLKVLWIKHEEDNVYTSETPRWHSLAQEWHGTVLPLATLERLEIYDTEGVDTMALYEWADYVDFSALRSLELCERVEMEALQFWAVNLRFPSLERLVMDVHPDLERCHSNAFYDSLEQFISSLPPLTELELNGWQSGLPVEVIATRHGPRLKRLALLSHTWQTVPADGIRSIGEHCPLLEDMTITIQRSQGDKNEVAAYRALGTIRRLKRLSLTLDVSDRAICAGGTDVERLRAEQNTSGLIEPPHDPSFDDFDNQYLDHNMSSNAFNIKNGHMRRLLINSAIDKNLACSIFQTISSTKAPDAPLLERLIIDVKGRGTNIGYDEIASWAGLMSSTWTIHRDLLYEHRHELIANSTSDHYARSRHLATWLETIFRRIWPEQKKGMKRKTTKKLKAKREKEKESSEPRWWLEWQSFPLDTEEA
ncbi:hypothetical protein FQN53_009629 [Emmonsiellopsis sp. PD_33]|nr:hypothetical protein FQN53_009629 [Emmonsiellopsis sp. PD_33]